MNRVIGYTRVSTDDQEINGQSLDMQESKIRAYCTAYDLELVDIIQDTATSKTLDREGMITVLQMLDSGAVEGVIVFKLDRLTRSIRDLNFLLESHFSDNESSLYSVSDHLDTKTATGRLMLNLLVSVSQWERESIGERTHAVLQHKKSIGEHIGTLKYGSRIVNKRLVIDEAENAIIEQINELKEQKLTLQAIADKLNSDNILTKRGKKWQPQTVKNYLNKA